jgi:hypothetical protein
VELRPLTGPLSVPELIHERIWSSGGMILTGSLSTRNSAWSALGANPELRSEKVTTVSAVAQPNHELSTYCIVKGDQFRKDT